MTITIAGIIGQRVIAQSPQTGRRFTGVVVGQQFAYGDGQALLANDEPIVIVQLDDGGLMRVFASYVKLEEDA